MSEKSQEQRIEDVAKQLSKTYGWHDWGELSELGQEALREEARVILEAADAPPKTMWPTDASLDVMMSATQVSEAEREGMRSGLRSALIADPIVQAAITVANSGSETYRKFAVRNLRDAVKDAGLL